MNGFWGILVLSSITFILYAFDKSAAKSNRRRIAEKTLHLCSLIGGWPGAFLAQRLFRHKTKKISFQIVYWLTVILNCVSIYYLYKTF